MPNPYGIGAVTIAVGDTLDSPWESPGRRTDLVSRVRPGMPWCPYDGVSARPLVPVSSCPTGRGGGDGCRPISRVWMFAPQAVPSSVESWSIRVIRVPVSWIAAEGASAPEPAVGNSQFGLRTSTFVLRPIGLPSPAPVSCPPVRRRRRPQPGGSTWRRHSTTSDSPRSC